MKKLIGLVLIPSLIVGCQSPQDKADSIEIDKCIITLKSVLKDPDSLKILSKPTLINVKDKLLKTEHRAVAIKYNAKNGFGGYIGEDMWYCPIKN
jgi:hypothetical protein